ncbi:replication factor a 1, rfa1, putative [Perkinsus marinus ATCC 50983]|uniref:Replication factor a 1, rfa1, putative n=1 Tax=Perkinsus marinus (strain ATCC 50983 / TXsc) TaxID=423536 RepID=C5LT07_PERM5|nr:replication factor a 1, rfa1, putative [Perkinsus marinus ATCC 50983]EER00144.1 replication factor a 1, rfa1, putative [Perkinsus marinus ATCC 50983]|eukprot:XP_002767426.1 replication factor a 1, rfa1, putative [Perkinsus marinus ATCC 50983]
MSGYNPPESSMLTRGAISRLPTMSPNELNGYHPILQITAVAAMGTADNGTRRLRVVVSDGIHCSSAMPFGHLLQGNVQFRQYALCRCTFSSANVKGKHVFLIKDCEEVCPPLRDAIGNPTIYRPSSATMPNNAANENVPSHGNGMAQPAGRGSQLQHYPTLDDPTTTGGYPQYGGSATTTTGYQQQTQHQYQQPPSGGGSSSGAGSSGASGGRQLPTFMQQQQQTQNPHKVTGPPLRANPTNPYQQHNNQQQPMGGGMLSRHQTVSLGGNTQQRPIPGAVQPGRPQPPYQQQQQHYGGPQQPHSSGPVSYRPVASDIIPISQLSVYSQKWTIKGRVSSKSDVRTFVNARGEGQLFSIELVDDQNGEIRATFFNSAVTKFYPAIQQGRVYTFSKGQVKQANARFNPGAAYELTFNDDAIIEEANDSADIPRILYKISKIATIQDRNADEFVDLCGIITHCAPISTIVVRNTGQERARRNFTIVDDSGCSIEMTVWGETAQNCGVDENRVQYHPVVMIKNARISNYGGKSLTTASTTTLEVDPDDSRAFEVKNWWLQGGQTGAVQALSSGGGGAGGNAPKTVIE